MECVAGLLLVITHFLGCILQGNSPKDRWALVPLKDSVDQNLGVNLSVNEINLSLKTTYQANCAAVLQHMQDVC